MHQSTPDAVASTPISPEAARSKLDDQLKFFSGSFKEWYGNVYLRSDHWKDLRVRKFTAYPHRCHHCRRTKKLEIHHLRYKAIYDVLLTDLQILCAECHRRTHKSLPLLEPKRIPKPCVHQPPPQKMPRWQRDRKRRITSNYTNLMQRGRL